MCRVVLTRWELHKRVFIVVYEHEQKVALVAAPVLGAHAWRPSPSPQPPSSPPLGAREGEALPHLPPSPLPLPRWGRGRGRALPLLPPGPLPLPHGERKGDGGGWRERTPETAHAIVACWERGPLARILMDGTGEHWLQCQYCGARLAALTFPPAPFLSPAGGEEGGGRCLPFPLAPSAPLRGEEGGGAASPSPWPPFSSSMGADEKERRKLLTQWLRAGRAGLWPAS